MASIDSTLKAPSKGRYLVTDSLESDGFDDGDFKNSGNTRTALERYDETSELDLDRTLDSNISLSQDAMITNRFQVARRADEYERKAADSQEAGNTPVGSR
jgi:hypothetical protein